MSWSLTAKLLRTHLDLHRKRVDPADDLKDLPWFRALHYREIHYRPQIDYLCEKFIFSGEWPAMNKLQTSLVAYRLAWGIKLADAMETAFPASRIRPFAFPTELSEAQILHWLLIDTWSASGEASGKETANDHIVVSLKPPPKKAGE